MGCHHSIVRNVYTAIECQNMILNRTQDELYPGHLIEYITDLYHESLYIIVHGYDPLLIRFLNNLLDSTNLRWRMAKIEYVTRVDVPIFESRLLKLHGIHIDMDSSVLSLSWELLPIKTPYRL